MPKQPIVRDADQLSRADAWLFWFGSVLVQLIVVPLVSFLLILPIGAVLEGSGPYSAEIHHPVARAGMPLISLLGGYLLGCCARSVLPRFARTGTWAWVLWTAFLASGFLLSLKHASPTSAFLSMFDVEGKEAIAVWLITLPAIFSAGYSLAYLFRRATAKRSPPLPSPPEVI